MSLSKLFAYVLVVILVHGTGSQESGKFWHISDHHLDPYYTPGASDPIEICPSSYGRPIGNAGPAGNHKWVPHNEILYAGRGGRSSDYNKVVVVQPVAFYKISSLVKPF